MAGSQSIFDINHDNILKIFDSIIIDSSFRMMNYNRYLIGREINEDSLIFMIRLKNMVLNRSCEFDEASLNLMYSKIKNIKIYKDGL